MSTGKRRPRHAGNIPIIPPTGRTYSAPRTDGVIGRAVGPAGRLPFPPGAPSPAGGLTADESFLLEMWLSGRTDADMCNDLGVTADRLGELKRVLWGRLQTLKLDDQAPAAG